MRVWRYLSVILLAYFCCSANQGVIAEDRSFDGTGNNVSFPNQGASNQPLVRILYPSFGQISPDGEPFGNQPSPRLVSNRISSQTESVKSARGLSDFIWAWGQFVAHDLSLTLTDDGARKNGATPIEIDEGDPLAPGPIPFVRSNFITEDDIPDSSRISPFPCELNCREQINVNTSYLDASTVYGSTSERAKALRTEDGVGARLLTSDQNLLPFNTTGLENENTGRFADAELFVAGDIRSNENVLLTSMHTVFMREHNRLVDAIETEKPTFTPEETYQLARKLVGAQVQAITYNEYLPALLGRRAPKASGYEYDADVNATATQSFSHGVNRWGHSATSPQLQLVNEQGTQIDDVALRDAFSNPEMIVDQPEIIDQLLRGAASQVSQEIDTLVVDELRNALFGPPGDGGLDLVALNIQRGRDHAIPQYVFLQLFYGIEDPTLEFEALRKEVSEPLGELYSDPFVMDAWVGSMAERPVGDGSLGRLAFTIVADQFTRLRDGDRLFYRSTDAGLYEDGELKEDIKSIVDLDSITLSDVIMQNTGIASLQDNLFFVPDSEPPFNLKKADLNGDALIDATDIDLLTEQIANGENNAAFDMNEDGVVSELDRDWMLGGLGTLRGDTNLDLQVQFDDFLVLSSNFGQAGGWSDGDFDGDDVVAFADFLSLSANFGQSGSAAFASAPEPNATWMLVLGLAGLIFCSRHSSHRRRKACPARRRNSTIPRRRLRGCSRTRKAA